MRLLTGLAVTLWAVGVYSAYTISQIRSLRQIQAQTIDRNRMDSLLLLRIQNDLSSVGLAMRDMLDATDPYPLTAWRPQFKRIRNDLNDALERERKLATAVADQRSYLAVSVAQFWDALDRTFALAEGGRESEARASIRLSLQARQAALTAGVARLLVQNNEGEQQAAGETQVIYARVERNVYLFLAAMLALVGATTLYLIHYNRRMFDQVASLSQARSELAQQLISIQENTFRYISRELHDEFGQVLTAIGAMLQRADRRASALDAPLRGELEEVRQIVQSTLEKVRSLSQALHPVVLDDIGVEGAVNAYIPAFQKQTGIQVRFEKAGQARNLEAGGAIHLYRILQEALNNVARHSKSATAVVRLRYLPDTIVLEVEDEGVGFGGVPESRGMGVASMRERAGLLNGRIDFRQGSAGGTLVRLTIPAVKEGAHAGA